jgi:uncharacterized protein DUF29
MPEDLFERDPLIWAERQADLLRRLAAGEGVNDTVDWPNVIEEVRDVGLSEPQACQSPLVRALAHLLKLRAWPDSPAAGYWRGETAALLADARRGFTPSMRQRIDLADLYADALHEVEVGADNAIEPCSLPRACPFTLDDLLTGRPNLAGLVAQLSGR